MIFRGIEICCPHCKGDLRETADRGRETEDRHTFSSCQSSDCGLGCSSCDRRFPVLLGIPDLRIFPDPYIDFEADRAKGIQVAARFDELSLAELVDFYYSITPAVPPHHARKYTRGLLAGVVRAEAALDSWENVMGGNGQPSSAKLLDVGCGTAPFLVAAAPRFSRVVGVDIAFRWLVVAKKRLTEAGLDIPLICACAEALPFPDEAFDRVIADSVIEHVQDQRKALAECHRVTRNAGSLCISTPNRYSLGPDPQAGIWAGGYLPDRWLAAYVRWQGGIPPKRHLLSAWSLPRLIQDAGFTAPKVFLPDIPRGQRHHFARGVNLLVHLYHVVKRIPVGRHLLQWIGPLLHAVSEKPGNSFLHRPGRTGIAGAKDVVDVGKPMTLPRAEVNRHNVSPMNPFRNILRLSAGDFLAKALNFIAFVYLARVLGVAAYGVLEFAISILMYFLLLADGGLELWAIREAAQAKDMRQLAGRVVPLRFLLAVGGFAALLSLLPIFPDYPTLRLILVLFGLTLFVQAGNLKWVFMGQEKMTRVAAGLVVAQVVFAGMLFGLVRDPAGIVWVPVLRLAGDLAMAAYFLCLFAATHGNLSFPFTIRGARHVLRPALTMGASHGLALVNYNFDSVLLGFILGPTAVGWYSAAYKPVTAALALPVSYFLALFPVLSRTYAESREAFREVTVRSLRLTSVFAVPLGVVGTFFAEPVIALLFGPTYANSVPALQVLSWSAVLVILRGTYRQALNAAGGAKLDLSCAGTSTAVNVGLNLLLISYYGIIGAAIATLLAEMVWLTLASFFFYRHLMPLRLLPYLVRPILAATAMAVCFLLTPALFWPVRGLLGVLIYLAVFLLLDASEVESWMKASKIRLS
jgi:O-antigen/teichoic acid export membrane protein/uncharacterized protein YbaR (Trm112 family)